MLSLISVKKKVQQRGRQEIKIAMNLSVKAVVQQISLI